MIVCSRFLEIVNKLYCGYASEKSDDETNDLCRLDFIDSSYWLQVIVIGMFIFICIHRVSLEEINTVYNGYQ